jgi:CBS domain containing-hemolysin-like protein
MKNLNFLQLQDFDTLVFPEDFNELSLESPALCFISDLKEHHPAVVTPSMSALDAAQIMRLGHLSAVLVVDSAGSFVGLLTAEDISYQRIIQCVASGLKREELTVADLMRPRKDLKMLSYQQLESSSIREVLEAMGRNGQRDCLVVDLHNHHVRGLISATDVSLRLHAEITIEEPATSLADILRSVTSVH